jgi:hypothetical protein
VGWEALVLLLLVAMHTAWCTEVAESLDGCPPMDLARPRQCSECTLEMVYKDKPVLKQI